MARPARQRRLSLYAYWASSTTVSATPSSIFRHTFPTKPSQTITSAVPLGMSTPSTLPTKWIPGVSRSRACASTTRGGPLLRLGAVGEQRHRGRGVLAR